MQYTRLTQLVVIFVMSLFGTVHLWAINNSSSSTEKDFWHAIEYGDLRKVQELVSRGQADVNMTDWQSNRPLHLAVSSKHMDIVQYLVLHGAYVNVKNDRGETPLHLSINAPLNICQYLVMRDANLNEKNKRGLTALHLASKNMEVDHVRYLLNHGADPTLQDDAGRLPIDFVMDSTLNKAEQIRALLQSKS
jgi:ankyrin repeat protein